MPVSKIGGIRMPGFKIHVTCTWLAVADAVVFFLSFYLATWLYVQLNPASVLDSGVDLPYKAAVFAGVTALAMCSMALYEPRLRERFQGIMFRTLGAFALMALGMMVLIGLFPALDHLRWVFIYAAVIAFAGSLLTRTTFTRTAGIDRLKRRVAVLGTERRARHIAEKMRRKSDHHGFHIVGYIPVPEEHSGSDDLYPENSNQSVFEYVRDHNIHELVVALDKPREMTPERELMRCREYGVSVLSVMDFFEQEASKVLLDEASADWFVCSRSFWQRTLGGLGKRTFDIVSSLALLMVTWPLILLTILAIKWEDGLRAPVFFLQKRVGLNGRIFHVIKFRSMGVDAEADGRARWATANDARATRVGKVIRAVRLDELPQIINVLAGDMAFVGPRPERPEFVSELAKDIPFFEERHTVKPGITGWAQLNYPYGASVGDAIRKLEFDLYYVKNQSFLLDVLVVLQTVEVVLFRKGVR